MSGPPEREPPDERGRAADAKTTREQAGDGEYKPSPEVLAWRAEVAGAGKREPDRRHSSFAKLLHGEETTNDGPTIIAKCAAEIVPQNIRWLWPSRFPRRKVSVIAGHPGDGKSQICASIAAITTTGGRWPVDRSEAEIGNAIILSAEDDPDDTIVPRLIAAGADLSRVHIVEALTDGYSSTGQPMQRAFDIGRDLAALERMIEEIGGVCIVIIDPISSYLGAVDSHKNAEVRAVLAPLSAFASKHDLAVIAVSHLSKGGSSDSRMRVTGSAAFVAAARASWLVSRDPDDESRRLMLPMKVNLAKDGGTGLAYRIQSRVVRGDISTSTVEWEAEAVTMTANEALNAPVPEGGRPADDAREFLLDLLGSGRPMLVRQIQSEARDAGHAWRTIERVKPALGIVAERSGFGKDGGWTWRLIPAKSANTPKTTESGGEWAEQGAERASGNVLTIDRHSAMSKEDWRTKEAPCRTCGRPIDECECHAERF